MQSPVSHFLDTSRLGGIHVAAAAQALIQVGAVDARKVRKSGSFFRGDGHIGPNGSESLGESKHFVANRIVKMDSDFHSDLLEPALMETASERRRRKLGELCAEHGRAVIAEKSGLSSVALEQILKGVLLPAKKDGTRRPKSLGDQAARAIEDALGLGEGWFDNPEVVLSPKAQEMAVKLAEMPPDRLAVLENLYHVAMGTPYLGGLSGFGDLDDDPKTGTKK